MFEKRVLLGTQTFSEEELKPASDSPAARALLNLLKTVLESSRGSPGEAEFTASSGQEPGSNPAPEAKTAPGQQEPVGQAPRPLWRPGDLLLGRSRQVTRESSTSESTVQRGSSADSSKKPTSSPEGIYIEVEDSYGRYLKVAVQ